VSGGPAEPAPAPVPFAMIVLAGGRAVRLDGADKPALLVGGRTLLESVIAAGTGAGAQPVIVVGPDRPGLAAAATAGPGAPRVVREEPPGAGPVPALRRGLAELDPPPAHAEAGWVAVLAADLPFLRPAHLRALLAAAGREEAGAGGAVLTDDGGRPQWLAGCWRIAALREAAGRYPGTSLRGLLGPLHPVSVRIEPGPGQPPPWLDCDTEADLRRARDWAARGRAPAPGPPPSGRCRVSGS